MGTDRRLEGLVIPETKSGPPQRLGGGVDRVEAGTGYWVAETLGDVQEVAADQVCDFEVHDWARPRSATTPS